MIERALALVDADCLEAGGLLCLYGWGVYFETLDYCAAENAFERALTIAEHESDLQLQMHIHVKAGRMDWLECRFERALEKCSRAIELSKHFDDFVAEAWARYIASSAALRLGDLPASRIHAAPLVIQIGRLRTHPIWLFELYRHPLTYMLEGKWQTARELNERALKVDEPYVPGLLQRALLEYQVGDFDQGNLFLEQFLEKLELPGKPPTANFTLAATAEVVSTLALISGKLDQLALAEDLSTDLLRPTTAGWPRWHRLVLSGRTGASIAAILRTDRKAASEHYPEILPSKGTVFGACAISSDRLLGLLAHTLERTDQAAVHFEEALDFCRKAGYRPELAWTSYDYAGLLLQFGPREDAERALSLLGESLTIASELDMLPLKERITQRLQRTEATTQPDRAYPNRLTEREVQVLRLVASGATNHEIADSLFISTRTVANHVKSILRKTSTANRTEAAAYAFRQGLSENNQ